jgi:hypothetical protein
VHAKEWLLVNAVFGPREKSKDGTDYFLHTEVVRTESWWSNGPTTFFHFPNELLST